MLEKIVCRPVLLVAVVALQGVVVHLGGQLVQVNLEINVDISRMYQLKGTVCFEEQS